MAYLLSDCLAGAAVVSEEGGAVVSEHQAGDRGLSPSSSEVIQAQRRTAAAAAERAGEDREGPGGSAEDDEGEESGGSEGKGDAAAALRRLSARSSKRLAELVTAQVGWGGSIREGRGGRCALWLRLMLRLMFFRLDSCSQPMNGDGLHPSQPPQLPAVTDGDKPFPPQPPCCTDPAAARLGPELSGAIEGRCGAYGGRRPAGLALGTTSPGGRGE